MPRWTLPCEVLNCQNKSSVVWMPEPPAARAAPRKSVSRRRKRGAPPLRVGPSSRGGSSARENIQHTCREEHPAWGRQADEGRQGREAAMSAGSHVLWSGSGRAPLRGPQPDALLAAPRGLRRGHTAARGDRVSCFALKICRPLQSERWCYFQRKWNWTLKHK